MMSSAAGGESLDVDDVFSAYSYKGTASSTSITNGLAFADGIGGGTSTKFSGESGNNLRRTSDFSGNSDSTTFTFSAWVLRDENVGQHFIYSADDGTYAFSVSVKSGGDVLLTGWQGTTRRLQATQSGGNLPVGSWFHLLISIDLSSSSNRYVYINDVNKTSQFGWQTYSNDPIEFTRSNHNIAQQAVNTGRFKGNLAHVYLDYTYRNLSTTSNRRLFIGADGGSTSPSTLSALNPIMYLPMTEDYSLGENLGTGGDLVANGPPTIVNKGTEYLSDHGKGGMIWTKARDGGLDHIVYDTERGFDRLQPQGTAGEAPYTGGISSYNSDGYSMGNGNNVNANHKYVSWSFLKNPKFFDIQTFTTTYNNDPNVISHDLDGELGCAIFKQRDTASQGYNWIVYHRSLGLNKYLRLNSSGASVSDTNSFEAVDNSAGTISVGYPMSDVGSRIVSGGAETTNWVGYFFAHNDGDGEFGPNSDQDIIKCGSFTMGTQATIDLGFEPQWLMVKKTTGDGQWMIVDNTRGWGPEADIGTQYYQGLLYASLPNAEAGGSMFYTTKSGFVADSTGTGDFIYIAIRRGPLSVPTVPSEVFDVKTQEPNQDLNGTFISSSTGQADMLMTTQRSHAGLSSTYLIDTYRMSNAELQVNSAAAETRRTSPYYYQLDYSNGLLDQWSYPAGSANTPIIYWMWKRAPGYLEIVAYGGTGTTSQTINHNLGVVPEMMWVKRRNGAGSSFLVYHKDVDVNGDGLPETDVLDLTNNDGAFDYKSGWNDTAPTSTQFTVGSYNNVNSNGNEFIAFLFASVPGVSELGSYTGNGSSQTINCGFTAGARFVLIKRTDNTGDWYVWDTARGIVAGNDPHLSLNSTTAEVTSDDSVDPANNGFIVNQLGATNINVSSAKYIFYAIA